jgi:hypothetical protein
MEYLEEAGVCCVVLVCRGGNGNRDDGVEEVLEVL